MTLFVDYNSLTTGIINYLAANSATINTSLAIPIKYLQDFSPDVTALPNDKYPAVSVNLISHEEETDDIMYGRLKITTQWQIGCHIKTLNSHVIAKQQARLLCANVEHAIRLDPSLSTTFHEFFIKNSEFDSVINEQGVYQINAQITLEGISYV